MFSLQSDRQYPTLLNIYRQDGENTADEYSRFTVQDTWVKLVFIPAGCHLQGWVEPRSTPTAFAGAFLDLDVNVAMPGLRRSR